jgi:hypothetical protein
MLKTLKIAFLVSTLMVTGTVVAQAHHKVGHCFPPGVVVAGCSPTPQTPQLPKPAK